LVKDAAFVAFESERAALGAAMTSPYALAEALTLTANDFYDPRHKALFDAIRVLYAEHKAVDLIAVNEYAEKHEIDISTADIITMAQDALPSTIHIHLSNIREAKRRRMAYNAALSLQSLAGQPGADINLAAADFMAEMRGADSGVQLISSMDATMKFCERMNFMQKGGKEKRAYTGIPALDEAMGGLHGPKMYIVGARPGTGKTAFALCVAGETSRHGWRTLFVNLEMPVEDLIARIVADYANIDVGRIDRGELTPSDHEAMGRVYNEIAAMKIDYTPKAKTPDQVRAAIMKANKYDDLALVVIDYAGYMRSGKHVNSRIEEMSEVSRALVEITRDTKIPVMAIVQVNRDSQRSLGGASASSRAPTMAELRDTGAWEQDADVILMLYAPDENSKLSDKQRAAYESCKESGMKYVQIHNVKSRQSGGAGNYYNAALDGAHMRFRRLNQAGISCG
jgi:replicative DNA helicase